MEDKEAKKRAALAKYVKSTERNLTNGLRSMRYWCRNEEADQCEKELLSYHKIFTEMTADKQTIIDTVNGLENISFYMMCIYNQGMCGAYGYKIDEQYSEEIDKNYMDYINKVQKSVDAKQKHAPGFD